jgi:metallo-beta-lactamase family protein
MLPANLARQEATGEEIAMHVTFFGAAREVTGSMHLCANGGDRILLDCGMFQGRRKESEARNRVLPLDPRLVTTLILSHAHIDHSGRIPLLTRRHFNGRVVCTRATAEACAYLLRDSASIQESDADYLNYKTARNFLYGSGNGAAVTPKRAAQVRGMLRGAGESLNREAIAALLERHRLERVEPLYTVGDAEAALGFFDGYPYGHPVEVGRGMRCTFYDAGHILGSAFVALRADNGDRRKTILFSGDIGRFDKPIIKNPTLQFAAEDSEPDLMIMESTYGDRLHEPVGDLKSELARVVNATAARGGAVLIPAFAFGRTQELVYLLHELYQERAVPRIPIHVDSPLATRITQVFGEHPETYDSGAHESFLRRGINPFAFDQLSYVQTVEESMALNRNTRPHIVLAGAGMCEGGRILHHLRHKIHGERNTILIVGFMAQHTLGRRILEEGEAYTRAGRKGDPPVVRFLNKEYPLKAHVERIGGFSAHADRDEMLALLQRSNLRPRRIAVVHGEEGQALAFAERLAAEGYAVSVPRTGETLHIP